MIIYHWLIICRNLHLALVLNTIKLYWLCAIDLEGSLFASVLVHSKRCSYDFDIQIDLLLSCLQLKYVDNEFESLFWRKRLRARDKPTQLNHLEIKHVIDKTEQQVDLTDDEKHKFSRLLLQFVFQNAF